MMRPPVRVRLGPLGLKIGPGFPFKGGRDESLARLACSLKSEEKERNLVEPYLIMNLNAMQTMDACGCQSRRRTYVATKVVGELPRSADPAVSEWGNPSLC